MKATNESSISSAYLQWLVVFFLTILIVLAAAFYGFSTPEKDYMNLRAQLELANSGGAKHQQYLNLLDQFNEHFKSYEQSGNSVEVENKNRELANLATADSSAVGRIVQDFCIANGQRIELQKEINARKQGGNDENIAVKTLNETLADVRKEKEKAENDLRVCKAICPDCK